MQLHQPSSAAHTGTASLPDENDNKSDYDESDSHQNEAYPGPLKPLPYSEASTLAALRGGTMACPEAQADKAKQDSDE